MADSKDEDFCQNKGELDMSESSDVSCSIEDLLDELGSTTPRSDCDSLDSSFQGSRFKEFRQSILANEDKLKRFLETSDEDTQDNVLFLRKLNYIADKTREILLFVKSVKDLTELFGSEMKKQDGNLEVKNYLDDKWCKASAAYRSMHNTIMGMKDMTTKINEFVDVSIPNFEQHLSKHAIENRTIDQALDKQYAEIWKLHDELREVADRVKNIEELHKSFLSHISVISVQMKEYNKCQQDIKSTLYHVKKRLEMPDSQQHYLTIRSCPTSPSVSYNSNVSAVPLNNSFPHASPSLLRVDENGFGDIHFINKRKLSSQDWLFQKSFSGKLLKENTPPFLVELEPVEKDTEVTNKGPTGCNNVRKGDLFVDILGDCEPKIKKTYISCKEDKEVPLPASNDSKTKSKQARIQLKSAVPVSEPTVININKKANASQLLNIVNNSACSTNKQFCDEKSIPTIIAPFSAVSIGKKPLEQQNKNCEKEQHSKKNGSISTPAPEVYEIDDEDDEVIFIENVVGKTSMHQQNMTVSKGNAMSEENVTAMQQKSRAASAGKQFVNNEQPNQKENSNGKVISQEVTPSSISKVPHVQEKRGCRSRERDLKKNVSKALSVNDNDMILAKIPCNVPLQSNQKVVMPGEHATVPNTPSHPSISGKRGPYQFRTEGPHSKRIKI